MSKYVYKWKYWFAWRPVKDVGGKWVWWKDVITNGKVYVQFEKRGNHISVMVPLDHMEAGGPYFSEIERK